MPPAVSLAAILITVVLATVFVTRYVARDRAIREMRDATERRTKQLRERHRG